MLSRAELKAKAKEQLRGNVWMFLLVTIILGGIAGLLSFIPFIGPVAAIVIVPPLTLGFYAILLEVSHGEKVNVGTLFSRFDQVGPSVFLNILIAVFTFLWSLLFVIPGIIKGYSYIMAFFILAENPDMTAREALNESKEIMRGHKWELFVLELSFILWMLLVSVTFGLAAIYVLPYMNLTITNFYHEIKRKNNDYIAEEVVYESTTSEM